MEYNGMYGGNKVKAIETKQGIFCMSYATIVAGIVGGKLKRYWGGYSKTTMAHIGAFVTEYNARKVKEGKTNERIEWLGCKSWDKMRVCKCPLRIAA